jgi:hypothetical protein
VLLAQGCAGGLTLTPIQSTSTAPSNVAVYFRVATEDGTPIPELTAEQFEIYEDDQLVSTFESKQTILNPEVAATHFTLLLVDMSGSVSESGAKEQVVAAASLFTQQVEGNNVVGVYAFDGSAELHPISVFPTPPKAGANETAKAKAKARADAQTQGGIEQLTAFETKDTSTNLNGAIVEGVKVLDEALALAENPLRFGTLVVFTDGTDRAARVSRDDMLQAIAGSPYEVFAIGLGGEISEDDLKAIGRSGTALAQDRDAVTKAFEEVGATINGITRSYYLLSYCSPARAGQHQVRVVAKVDDPKAKAKAEAKGKGDKPVKQLEGELSQEFDAEGFEAGCDPNTPPAFDITQGENAAGEVTATSARRR